MKDKKSIRDIMFENIQAEHEEEIMQGDILRELENSKNRQNNYIKEAFIYGANYYTIDKLKQIRDDAKKYLFKDIDVEGIKTKISEELHPDIGQLEALYKIENKIWEVKQKLANDCDSSLKEDSSICSSLVDFVDWINGGGNNEN